MARFEPKITKARFSYSGFTTDQMLHLGQTVIDLNFKRFDNGLNAADTPVKPLSEKYAKFKQRRGGQPIRDLKLTGRLRRSLKPLSANQNRVTMGPADPVALSRLAFNQRRERMWGISPTDRQAIVKEVSSMKSGLVKSVSEAEAA